MTTILGHILPERIRFTCITDPVLSPPQWQAFNTAWLFNDRINRVSLYLTNEPAGLNQARII